jgi:hypothetical protein
MNRRSTEMMVFVILISLAVSAQDTGTLAGAKEKTQASRAQESDKSTKSRSVGDDPNIKQGKEQVAKNSPGNEPPAPPQKGGARSRGPLDCWLTIDNWSPWWIDVYIDGTYRGEVSPFGKGTVNAGFGGTMLYARANFTDATFRAWGPRQFLCSSNGQFNWRLDP